MNDAFANNCIEYTRAITERRRNNDKRAIAAIEKLSNGRQSAAPPSRFATPSPGQQTPPIR